MRAQGGRMKPEHAVIQGLVPSRLPLKMTTNLSDLVYLSLSSSANAHWIFRIWRLNCLRLLAFFGKLNVARLKIKL